MGAFCGKTPKAESPVEPDYLGKGSVCDAAALDTAFSPTVPRRDSIHEGDCQTRDHTTIWPQLADSSDEEVRSFLGGPLEELAGRESSRTRGVPSDDQQPAIFKRSSGRTILLSHRFEELTCLCRSVCKVSMCCISDFHSDLPWTPQQPAARRASSVAHQIPFCDTPFCKWTLRQPPNVPLVIEDTLLDERFSSSPHVMHAPHIRFFAGISLASPDGNFVGALCIMDTSPAAQGALPVKARLPLLTNFANMAARQLTRDQMLTVQQAAGDALLAERAGLLRLMDMVGHATAVMLIEVPPWAGDPTNLQMGSVDLSGALLIGNPSSSGTPQPPATSSGQPYWRVVCVNEAWEASTGHVSARIANHSFWSLCRAQGEESVAEHMRRACCAAVAGRLSFSAALLVRCGADGEGEAVVLRLLFNSADRSSSSSSNEVPRDSSTSLAARQPSCYFVSIASASNPVNPIAAPCEAHNSGHSSGMLLSAGLTLLDENPTSKRGTPRPSVEMERLEDRSALLLDQAMHVTQDLQIESLLGHGSFGRVYKGRYGAQPVAIKVLQCTVAQASGHELEALLPSHIEHPNVLRTYKHCTRPLTAVHQEDVSGQRGDSSMVETWMVMEYAEHGTLSDAVAQGRFHGGVGQVQAGHGGFGSALYAEEAELNLVLNTAREVASAMCHLHSLDILHGDLTGSNILLCSAADEGDGCTVAKVADFGLSRLLASDRIRTKTYGEVSHTPPELLLTGSLSKAVDVYAFGVILWEVLTGQQPYRGLSQAQIISHISNGRSLDIRSEWPSGLRKLVAACLCTQPDRRPSFLQVLLQLDALQEQLC